MLVVRSPHDLLAAGCVFPSQHQWRCSSTHPVLGVDATAAADAACVAPSKRVVLAGPVAATAGAVVAQGGTAFKSGDTGVTTVDRDSTKAAACASPITWAQEKRCMHCLQFRCCCCGASHPRPARKGPRDTAATITPVSLFRVILVYLPPSLRRRVATQSTQQQQ